ncbi:hypothetical protein JCM30204_51880 [Dysgonomonas termitidis]
MSVDESQRSSLFIEKKTKNIIDAIICFILKLLFISSVNNQHVIYTNKVDCKAYRGSPNINLKLKIADINR